MRQIRKSTKSLQSMSCFERLSTATNFNDQQLSAKDKSTEADDFDQDHLITRNESLDQGEEHDLEWFSHMNLGTRSFLRLGTCSGMATGVTGPSIMGVGGASSCCWALGHFI